MAEPLKSIRSLDEVSTDYSIFERDQVLTEGQLNSISRYFEDQGRLTRVGLLGVGIVGGLQVGISGGKVVVGKGAGVTTDGDLLMLDADTAYDCVKPYDESAPIYPPFYGGEGGKMLALRELVREGESDVRKAPLSTLPGKLQDYAVIMYMESCARDSDLCNATDCDNLGITATHIPRLLLVARADAAGLLVSLSSAADLALQLPEMAVPRPRIGSAVGDTGKLAALYRTACDSAHARWARLLEGRDSRLPATLAAVAGSDLASTWLAPLKEANALFASRDEGIQYYYDFLKDIAETWNEMREALLADDSVLCPDFAAFPKHLLLGALNAPAELRTGLYPSPLTGDGRAARRRAQFLLRRLDAMIHAASFPLPAETPTRITPSRSESCTLAERAIPFYYAQRADKPIQPAWSEGLSRRRALPPGYRWDEYTGSPAPDFFAAQIGRNDFFRIEGHLGQKVEQVAKALEKAIADNNLPIAVRSILLHGERRHILIRPPRYGDLHRFHHLLRREVSTQLQFSKKFNATFTTRLTENTAVDKEQVQGRGRILDQAVDRAVPALEVKRYSQYRQTLKNEGGNWKGDYRSVLQTAGAFKSDFGDRLRNDFVGPFDTVINSNHGIWLDWLDSILDRRDERADDRLLFGKFIEKHPGLEHFGGVSRGGTFVLAYDERGVVVADFMLPYFVAEDGEEEDDEPDLSIPSHRVPDLVDKGFRVVDTLDERFGKELGKFEKDLEPKWKGELKIQTDYMKFFENSLGTLSDVLGKTAGKTAAVQVPKTGDDYLDLLLDGIQGKEAQVQRTRSLLAEKAGDTAAGARLGELLGQYEHELADMTAKATGHLVASGSDVAAGQPAAGALPVIAGAMAAVKDAAAVQTMSSAFGSVLAQATPTQQLMVTSVMSAGGLKLTR